MNYEELKQRVSVRAYAEAHLERRGRDFICPCGSGNGPKKSPAFKIQPDGTKWRCFSCDRGGDVFDLAGYIHGAEDRAEQYRLVAEFAGEQVENRSMKAPHPKPKTYPGREKERVHILEAQKHIGEPEALEYLSARGITAEEANAWKLGYDPHEKRLVIPWKGSSYYHIDRDTTDKDTRKYTKPKAEDVGEQPLYNPEALAGDVFFIVEGVLDALAIGEKGVALGSTNNARTLEAIKTAKGIPILLLDADEHGREGRDRIEETLEEAGVFFTSYDLEEGADPFSEYIKDREAFRALLSRLEKESLEKYQEHQEEEYIGVLKRSNVKNAQDVLSSVYMLNDRAEPIPTGFSKLDNALEGGLPGSGLVILGAQSSVGKTTLAGQIADNIAESGRSVLFVTVEQSSEELVAKSISRLMANEARADGSPTPVSSQHLLRSAIRAGWIDNDPEKVEALNRACSYYADNIASNIRYQEPDTQPFVEDIRKVAGYIAKDGAAPVVIVDYLQLLAAADPRDPERIAVDRNISRLRQIAREMKTCVFVISSLNRGSYRDAINLDSFKESGGIEYGADLLIGLQPAGLDERAQGENVVQVMKDYKTSPRREVELVVLKNRNGAIPAHALRMEYNALTNTFKETR